MNDLQKEALEKVSETVLKKIRSIRVIIAIKTDHVKKAGLRELVDHYDITPENISGKLENAFKAIEETTYLTLSSMENEEKETTIALDGVLPDRTPLPSDSEINEDSPFADFCVAEIPKSEEEKILDLKEQINKRDAVIRLLWFFYKPYKSSKDYDRIQRNRAEMLRVHGVLSEIVDWEKI